MSKINTTLQTHNAECHTASVDIRTRNHQSNLMNRADEGVGKWISGGSWGKVAMSIGESERVFQIRLIQKVLLEECYALWRQGEIRCLKAKTEDIMQSLRRRAEIEYLLRVLTDRVGKLGCQQFLWRRYFAASKLQRLSPNSSYRGCRRYHTAEMMLRQLIYGHHAAIC